MDRFLIWLQTEVKGTKNVIGFAIIACYAAMLLNLVSSIILLLTFGIQISISDVLSPAAVSSLYFFIFLAAIAILEEIVFRFFPLHTVVGMIKKPRAVLFVAIIVSIIFGYLHGNWQKIFLQGMTGFVLSCVYLKCGGFQKRWPKALAASSLTHILFNFTLVILATSVAH